MMKGRVIPVVGRCLVSGILLLLFSGCRVHQFPEYPEGVDSAVLLKLDLLFDYEIPQYKIVDYSTKSRLEEYPDGVYPYRARYTVNAYRYTSTDSYSPDPDYTFVFTGLFVEVLEQTFVLPLDAQKYRIKAFVDFVDKDSCADTFYSSGDFDAITIVEEEHVGDTDFKDAFVGELDVDLSRFTYLGASMAATVNMVRPVAKYAVVATDLVDFLETQGVSSIEGYYARFAYSGFFPDTYNMTKNSIGDARTGVGYVSDFLELEGGEVELGFDYVLTGVGNESTVDATVSICRPSGETVTSVWFSAPLYGGKLTTVKGRFLTGKSTGGIGISPSFDGEIEIVVP